MILSKFHCAEQLGRTVVLRLTRPCQSSRVFCGGGRQLGTRRVLMRGCLISLQLSMSALLIRPDMSCHRTEPTTVHPTTLSSSRRQTLLSLLQSLLDTIFILFRGVMLFFTFLPCLLTAPLLLTNAGLSAWLDLFLWSCELAGPVFVKLVQWASTRRDIFSDTVCDKFSRLQRSTRPHSWDHTHNMLQAAFGEEYSKIILQLQPTPVGSGCCAQVYRAYVAENGELVEVAVKVVHPGLRQRLHRDLAVLGSLAGWLSWLVPNLTWLNLTGAVQEFADLMNGQVDMTKEAKNLTIFRHNFCENDRISFPRPLHELCSENILVETWVEGACITKYMRNDTSADVKYQLAQLGVEMILQMVFTDNYWHGDLHPGNIIVQSTNQGLCLAVLDTGITASLSAADRRNLLETFAAIVRGDGRRVGELFLDRSRHECLDKEGFIADLGNLVMEARGKQLTLQRVDVSKLLNNLFTIVKKHRVRMDASFSSVVLAVIVLEGLGRTLDPTLDLVTKAAPYLASVN